MTEHTSRPLIGAHMSVAGGLARAFERGQHVGCVTLQIFQRPNRQWRAPRLTKAMVEAFQAARRATGIAPVVAHACYLINLASDNAVTRRRSRRAFIDEVKRSRRLGLPGVILHPGSAADRETAIARIADGINHALDATPDSSTTVLLETTAGAGRSVGGRFEDLAEIIDRIEQRDRMGVCLDTCHVFAAGYDLRTRRTYRRTMRALDGAVGLDRLRVIHVNDATGDLGSRLDRHAHIGQGRLGEEAFRLLMTDHRLVNVPKIIETPKRKGRTLMDGVNLATLRHLAGERPGMPGSPRARWQVGPNAG